MIDPTPTFPTSENTWMLDLMMEPINRYRIADRMITYCNTAWAHLYEIDAAAAVGTCLDTFLSDDEMAGLHSQLALLGPDAPTLTDDTARAVRGAEERWLEWVDHYVVTDQGPEVLSIGRDVTDRHLTERRLAESEARFRSLADNTADVLWRTRGRPIVEFEYLSPSVERVLGYPAAWLSSDFSRLLSIAEPSTQLAIAEILREGHSPRRLDLEFRHADGHVVIGESSISFDESGAQGVMRDVTELRFLQRSLSALAATDPLTALSNRRRFDDLLTAALETERAIAVIYIDLDDLKGINDRYGHEAGDRVLQETAKRIASVVREPDTAARLGGDEFAIIHHVDGDSTRRLVADLDETLRSHVVVADRQLVSCSASVGDAVTTVVGREASELVAAADQAMYRVKHDRRTNGGDVDGRSLGGRPENRVVPRLAV